MNKANLSRYLGDRSPTPSGRTNLIVQKIDRIVATDPERSSILHQAFLLISSGESKRRFMRQGPWQRKATVLIGKKSKEKPAEDVAQPKKDPVEDAIEKMMLTRGDLPEILNAKRIIDDRITAMTTKAFRDFYNTRECFGILAAKM